MAEPTEGMVVFLGVLRERNASFPAEFPEPRIPKNMTKPETIAAERVKRLEAMTEQAPLVPCWGSIHSAVLLDYHGTVLVEAEGGQRGKAAAKLVDELLKLDRKYGAGLLVVGFEAKDSIRVAAVECARHFTKVMTPAIWSLATDSTFDPYRRAIDDESERGMVPLSHLCLFFDIELDERRFHTDVVYRATLAMQLSKLLKQV